MVAAPFPAAAQGWSEKTTFTFDAPVVVPHTTLPAGTYVFKLADTDNSRSIVEIWNEDETKRLSTSLAIPIVRNDPADEVNVTFASTPEGMPPAVVAWFYPGQRDGNELVYPTKQARHIAETTRTLVLSSDTDADDPEAWRIATFMTFDEEGNEQRWNQSGGRTPGDYEMAQRGQASGSTSATAEQSARHADRSSDLTGIDESAGARADDRNRASTPDRDVATTDERDAAGTDDYTHRPPNVRAAPGEAEAGSGEVALHGLEGEDLAEHHLEHAKRLADEILDSQGSGDIDRAKIEELREHVDGAVQALNDD